MPAVTFIGAADVPHCTDMERAVGSSNVFVNGEGVSRKGDVNTVHLKPEGGGGEDGEIPCKPHAVGIKSGSSTVKVNGLGCGRVGDPTCTAVAEGSPNVFSGLSDAEMEGSII